MPPCGARPGSSTLVCSTLRVPRLNEPQTAQATTTAQCVPIWRSAAAQAVDRDALRGRVSLARHSIGVTLTQIAVGEQRTSGARHTQHGFVRTIHDGGGYCLMTAEANLAHLLDDLARFFDLPANINASPATAPATPAAVNSMGTAAQGAAIRETLMGRRSAETKSVALLRSDSLTPFPTPEGPFAAAEQQSWPRVSGEVPRSTPGSSAAGIGAVTVIGDSSCCYPGTWRLALSRRSRTTVRVTYRCVGQIQWGDG